MILHQKLHQMHFFTKSSTTKIPISKHTLGLKLFMKKLLFLFCISITSYSQIKVPKIEIEGKKIEFEQYLMILLSNDSLKKYYIDSCYKRIAFIKFAIDKKQHVSDIVFSPFFPDFLKGKFNKYLPIIDGQWGKKLRDRNFLLPVIINSGDCSKNQDPYEMAYENLVSIANFSGINLINENGERYSLRWRLMKKDRFEGIILHPVEIHN